jgi:hypothetical protein
VVEEAEEEGVEEEEEEEERNTTEEVPLLSAERCVKISSLNATDAGTDRVVGRGTQEMGREKLEIEQEQEEQEREQEQEEREWEQQQEQEWLEQQRQQLRERQQQRIQYLSDVCVIAGGYSHLYCVSASDYRNIKRHYFMSRLPVQMRLSPGPPTPSL